MIRTAMLSAALLSLAGLGAAAGEMQPVQLNPEELLIPSQPDVPRFGLWAIEVKYPAPTLFVFASSIEESLDNPYFRQCGNELAAQGYLLVSLDLPGHGMEAREGEPGGLKAWRVRSDQREDFIAPFVADAGKVLDYLIASGYADPDRIAACGTSRGGFMALQFAAAEPRIKATAAFAPVTALSALREFHDAENSAHVEALSLHARADALAGRSLWLVIGDRDARVDTDACIAFARRVTAASLAVEKPADVTLIVQPEPKGHTTPEGAPVEAATWISERLR